MVYGDYTAVVCLAQPEMGKCFASTVQNREQKIENSAELFSIFYSLFSLCYNTA
jgi:hypothetical protein